MKLTTHPYIDVSTGHLPQSDHDLLLRSDAPHHLATHDEFCGAFFYTLPDIDPETVKAFSESVREFGFSDQFLNIMVEASRNKVQLVRFDCDGDMIEGMELLEEEDNPLATA